MSEGLGLNHFADGLPYTPAHRRRPMVQFDFPPPRSPRYASSSPVAPVEAASPLTMAMPASAPAIQPQTAVAAEPAVAESLAVPVTAGLTRRAFAFLFDMALLSGIFAVVVWSSFSLNGFNVIELLAAKVGNQLILPLLLLYGVVYMGYFLIQETTWRRTLGKSAVGIYIRSDSGFATLGRAICFVLAAAPLGLGLLWCLFDRRKRCWHDVITDCEVVCN